MGGRSDHGRREPLSDWDACGAHHQVPDPAAIHRLWASTGTKNPARAGIVLEAATAELARKGVQSFCDSYDELLDCIQGKLGALVGIGH